MFCDIVLPDRNEKEFIEIAEKLGYTHIIFAYPFNKKGYPSIGDSNIKTIPAAILETKNVNKARTEKEIVIAQAGEQNRPVFESRYIDIIYGLECVSKKDFIHHKASGMNQVLGKFAQKNKIAIAFSFSMLLKSKGVKRAAIMARISQNIRICRKYNLHMITASFAKDPYSMRAPRDMMALMEDLGMTGSEAKSSMQQPKSKEKFI